MIKKLFWYQISSKDSQQNKFKDVMRENNCAFLFVPKNLTAHFQPLDLNVNGHAKQFWKRKFENWYAEQVTKEIEKGINVFSAVAAPATAEWEGNRHGQWDHALFASFQCFMPDQNSLGNMIYPYLVCFSRNM